MLNSKDKKRLEDFYSKLRTKTNYQLGYPIRCVSNTTCKNFLDFTINNLGDPFKGGDYKINSFEFEVEVLDYFAKLLNLNTTYSGYVSSGGTENNINGLFRARQKHPNSPIYYSNASHYSIKKAIRLLNCTGVELSTFTNGELNYIDFSRKIKQSNEPPIISLNIGTTMTGAIDNAEKVIEILKSANIEEYYIYCDAALLGIMLPFLNKAPVFDFRLPINSIGISGHKFLGCPIPSGVFITNEDSCGEQVDYLGSTDTTLTGSRPGIVPLILWESIKSTDIKESVEHCMKLKAYAMKKLKDINFPGWSNDFSNIIIIDRPETAVSSKWQLSCEDDIAHIIVMPHVTKAMIDALISDLSGSLYNPKVSGIIDHTDKCLVGPRWDMRYD